jgi:hypothetical protein
LVSNARKWKYYHKALFDFLNVLQNGSALADQLLRNFSFVVFQCWIPTDGYVYAQRKWGWSKQGLTKLNSTGKQSAAKYLIYFSLTIVLICMISVQFWVESTGKPTVSAPSYNEERSERIKNEGYWSYCKYQYRVAALYTGSNREVWWFF